VNLMSIAAWTPNQCAAAWPSRSGYNRGLSWAGSLSLGRWLRHEVAFDTAWLDASLDQALRVAAGIPRKHASGGQ
jgi:hypothetical protein